MVRTLSGHPRLTYARFGFAMATVGDISQDGLTDVAIGAPLEDFGADDSVGFGSVYIYNGNSANQLADLSTNQPQVIRRALSCLYSGTLTFPRYDGLRPKPAPVLSARQVPEG